MHVGRTRYFVVSTAIILVFMLTGAYGDSGTETVETNPMMISANDAGAQGIDYQALSLEDCLSLARKDNPVLSGATERIRELVADYQAAKSRFFPRLALASTYERTNPDRLSPAGGLATQPLFKEEALALVTGQQLLYDGGKTNHSTRAAKIGAEAQRQDVRRIADEVAFAVTEAFYRLMEAKENQRVTREALRERQDFATLAEAFFKAGKVTRLDSFRAGSQVSQAELAKIEAENAVGLAGKILARSIGLRENVPLDIIGGLPDEFTRAPDFDALWQEALKANPDLKRLDLEIEQSQALIKAARGGYFPEISLQGGVGVRHYDLGGTKGEWLVGVFVEFPFFDGGLTKAQVGKASSQYLQSLENKRDRLDGLKVDLASARQDQENAGCGIAAIRQIVAANEEAYASAQSLFRNGKAIGLDVLQAQLDLTGSRLSSIRYKVAYQVARARIEQIIGSGLSESYRQSNIGGQGR